MYNYTSEKLKSYLKNMYETAGLSSDDAKVCSELTVKTNLWGIDSHGILRTPVYVERVINGAVKKDAQVKAISNKKGPIKFLDADAAMGYVAGEAGMKAAIELAKEYGIGMVLVNNSNHFGAAGLYAEMAARQGLLGICTTNVIPNIGMPGNLQPSTGNNPLALGAPLYSKKHDFVLDISMSSVAGGKLLLAMKEGKEIPNNWAITKDGEATTDPKAGFEGTLLPMGMHKGFGMSLFLDIITGVLSGGPFLQDLRSMYSKPEDPSLSTHMMMVIDPEYFMSKKEYEERMNLWVEYISSTPMADEDAHQIIPGEIEYQTTKKRLTEGITIPDELYKDLKVLEEKLNMKELL